MIMWYNDADKKIKYDNAQLETEILLSWKRVFFIDGPSTCGKTHFVKLYFGAAGLKTEKIEIKYKENKDEK